MGKRSIFYISDSTGITAETMGHSLLAQFDGIDFDETVLPFVDTPERAQAAVDRINQAAARDGAPPIVFVHGFACSHVDWQAQVAHFSPAHTTVAVDLPGHGASKAPAERCNVALYGKDVATLLGALALSPALLFSRGLIAIAVKPEVGDVG